MSRGSSGVADVIAAFMRARQGALTGVKSGIVREKDGSNAVFIEGDETAYVLMGCCKPVFSGDLVIVFTTKEGVPVAFSGICPPTQFRFRKEEGTPLIAILYDEEYTEDSWCGSDNDGANCDLASNSVWLKYREIGYNLKRTLVLASDAGEEVERIPVVGMPPEGGWLASVRQWFNPVWADSRWLSKTGASNIFDFKDDWFFDERPLSISQNPETGGFAVISALHGYFNGLGYQTDGDDYALVSGYLQFSAVLIWRIDLDGTATILEFCLCSASLGQWVLPNHEIYYDVFKEYSKVLGDVDLARRAKTHLNIDISDCMGGVTSGDIRISPDGNTVYWVAQHNVPHDFVEDVGMFFIQTYRFGARIHATLTSAVSWEQESVVVISDVDNVFGFGHTAVGESAGWSVSTEISRLFTMPDPSNYGQHLTLSHPAPVALLAARNDDTGYLEGQLWSASSATLIDRVLYTPPGPQSSRFYWYFEDGDSSLQRSLYPRHIVAIFSEDESEVTSYADWRNRAGLAVINHGALFVFRNISDGAGDVTTTYTSGIEVVATRVEGISGATRVSRGNGSTVAVSSLDSEEFEALWVEYVKDPSYKVIDMHAMPAVSQVSLLELQSDGELVITSTSAGRALSGKHCGCPPSRFWRRGRGYQAGTYVYPELSNPSLPNQGHSTESFYRPIDPAIWCLLRK